MKKKILAISAITLMLLAIFTSISIISPTIAQPPSAKLTGTIYDDGYDADGDGLFDYLVVDVEVNVSVAGYYIVEVNALEGELGWYRNVHSLEGADLDVGLQNVSLSFSGIAIYGFRLNVTNIREISLFDQYYNTLDYIDTIPLSTTYYYTSFDTGAILTGVIFDEGVDTDGDGLFNFLQIGVEVNVTDAEVYQVSIWGLFNTTYYYVDINNQVIEYLDIGIQVLNVSLPGPPIYASHVTNIAQVSFTSLYLYDDGFSYELDSRSYLDLSGVYSYDEFETIAYFTGTIFDEGADEDGDSKIDYLKIGFEINVTEAGEYDIRLNSLVDNASHYMDVYESVFNYFDVGVYLINITVYGPQIYVSEFNPAVIGEAEIYSWSQDVVADKLTNVPLSKTYNYTDFESHALLTGNIFDEGVDTDGDGLYDYLAVGIEVNVTEAGTYEISAMSLLEQVNSTYYRDLYSPQWVDVYLEVGTHTVYLNYSGPRLAYEHFSPTNISTVRLMETVYPHLQLDYIGSAPLSTRYDHTLFNAPFRDMQINFVVYPDGKVRIGGAVNGTHMYPPNTGPSINATISVSTTGETTIILADGTLMPPQSEMTWPLDAIVAYVLSEYENGVLNATLDATLYMPPEASKEYPTNASDFSLSATYSSELLNIDLWGQTVIPSYESMFPFNVSDFTVLAEYVEGEIRGNITFHAVAGLPLTDVIVYFNVNETSAQFTGDLTVLYGTYPDIGEINATSLEDMLTQLNSTIPGRGDGSLYNMTGGMLECTQLNTTKTPVYSGSDEIGAEVAFNATINGNFTDILAQLMTQILFGGNPEYYPFVYASLDSAFSSVESASLEITYYHTSGTAELNLHLTDNVAALWSKALEVIPPTVPAETRTQVEAMLKIANATAYAISDFSLEVSYSSAEQKLDLSAQLLANINQLETETMPFVLELMPPELRSVFEPYLNTTYCTLTYSKATISYVNGACNFTVNATLQGDFKAEVNHIKRFYIDYLNATAPWMLGPELMLLNETEIDVNNCEAEFKIGEDWMYISFDGIVIHPPKDMVDAIRFKLYRLFNASSYDPEEPPGEFDKLKIVITGGSNETHTVLLYAPSTVPPPDETSLDYKTMTWQNVTLSSLKDLHFHIAYQGVVNYLGKTYYIPIFTNSTVSNFNFNPNTKSISFNVSGTSGTGFCNVTIPRALLYATLDEWVVKFDGSVLDLGEYSATENAEYVFIYLNYTHSSHLIEIKGTWVVAEFPPHMLPLVLIILSLAVLIVAIKQRRKLGALKAKTQEVIRTFANAFHQPRT